MVGFGTRTLKNAHERLERTLQEECSRLGQLGQAAVEPSYREFYTKYRTLLALAQASARALTADTSNAVDEHSRLLDESRASVQDLRTSLHSTEAGIRALAAQPNVVSPPLTTTSGQVSNAVDEAVAAVRRNSMGVIADLKGSVALAQTMHSSMRALRNRAITTCAQRLSELESIVGERNHRARNHSLASLAKSVGALGIDSGLQLIYELFELLPDAANPERKQEREVEFANEAWLRRVKPLVPIYEWCMVSELTIQVRQETQAELREMGVNATLERALDEHAADREARARVAAIHANLCARWLAIMQLKHCQ
ncbi:MAG: hypothetical protein K8S98_02100 [Planctomycetes bacterium]|nr:hypothetical protein [Planctomycetota bacterium]